MRAAFLFLVLANLVFFAWANFFSESDSQSDPRPRARQVAPEKLKIVPSGPAARPAAQAQDAVTTLAKGCLEIGGFSTVDAPRASEAFAPLALGARLVQRQVDEGAKWWVYMPPQGSRQDANRKAAELKLLGIDDYFVVQEEGPLRHALSLGIFKTEAAATSRLEALKAKGVRTAQVGARETTLQKVYFQVRAADDELVSRIREVARAVPGAELRPCQPAAT